MLSLTLPLEAHLAAFHSVPVFDSRLHSFFPILPSSLAASCLEQHVQAAAARASGQDTRAASTVALLLRWRATVVAALLRGVLWLLLVVHGLLTVLRLLAVGAWSAVLRLTSKGAVATLLVGVLRLLRVAWRGSAGCVVFLRHDDA